MPTLQRSPRTVAQTTGATVTFNGLDNLKNTSTKTYAITNKPIQGKNNNKDNTPSTIAVKDFKFNIPTNAIVKKITVHYRHSRVAACTKNGTTIPCSISNTDYRCNIPAPTITLLNTGLKKKGQAPYGKIGNKTYGKLNNTLTFDVNLKANTINNSQFGVKLEYPRNANNLKGYLLVNYIYVTIQYSIPNYTVSAQTANTSKLYNKQDYHLKVNCSDTGLTKQNTNVLISIPNGFTFKEPAGTINGKLTQLSDRSIQWTPDLNKGTGTIELIFDTNVAFASGTDSTNFTFTIGLPIYSTQITHSDTIYKPSPGMEAEDSDKDMFSDEDTQVTGNRQVWGTLNESFLLSLDLTDEEVDEYSDEDGDFPLSFRAFDEDGTASTDWYYSNIDNATLSQLSNSAWRTIDSDSQYVFNDYFKVLNQIGEYTLQVYAVVGGVIEQGMTEVMIRELNIRIRPPLETLTDLNYCLLRIDGEELDRLGDKYTYTVQSDMQLETSEEYVRDWYKNFRIGVFNNPIPENITTYFECKNIEETFDSYIPLPPNIDYTDSTLTVSANNPIKMSINTVEYTLTNPVTLPVEDYYTPVTFNKLNNDEVKLTLTVTKNNTSIYSTEYYITFNAEEDEELTEKIIDTTDYDNLTSDTILENAEYWSNTLTEPNTIESITTEFTYQNEYPLYIIITGDYNEGDIQNNNITFTEPCIIETSKYTQKQENGNYPVPIDDLVEQDGISEILIPSYNTSETIVFYDLGIDDLNYNDDTHIIRGIQLTGDIEQADNLVMYAKLKSPTGESRERSVIINETDDAVNSFSIGGNADLWGFTTNDMNNISDWEIEFNISNSINDVDGSINFGEIRLIIYSEEVQEQNIRCSINGEDISYYGAFLTDLNIPEGLQTDTAYLSVDGTDINDAYRQNIREKEISIGFEIGDGCSLEAATLSLREFAKLLVNDRDEYNRPIPKRIEFSHYPDVYWEYVMEDTFDSEIDINTYTVTAKLTVPAGTSYTRQSTTTSTSGYVNGLASINPVLIVKPTSDNLAIRETVTGQEFLIGYTGEWEDKILEIDCEDRICWLRENEDDTDPVNLNKYVDYNSDWFVLKGDYNFEGIGCMIRTVEYQERW